jgi:vancomycin resistance protein VanW
MYCALVRVVRRPLSELHPVLYRARVAQLKLARRLADRRLRAPFARLQRADQLGFELVRHESLLRRRLAGLDPRLQETKIVNLRLAAASIDGLLIRPGETFSFWDRVGDPTARRGFVEGLVLRHGEVMSGVGGGLCQLSNLLYWMALHSPLEVVEHHHHSLDPFPDDRRVQPFGSGASVYYNYGDLRLRNTTAADFQLRVWLTETHLHGAICSDRTWPLSYSVEERLHQFTRGGDGRLYRDNELWQRTVERESGATIDLRLITRNHALVKY